MDRVRDSGGWISPRTRVEGAAIRLFCLPHAGAGTAMFYGWKRFLPAWVEICPILLPGREARLAEDPWTDSRELIAAMTDALRGHLGLPYAIFGHSMGALLAFELAQSLRAAGQRPPEHLFVSGRMAPQLDPGSRSLHTLPQDRFIEAIDARYGGLPQEILANQELLEIYLPILRADLQLLETHFHGFPEPLDCPISAFAGADDPNVSGEALDAWGEQTSGSFKSRRFEGGHFYLNGLGKAPLLELLSERLTAIHDRVGGKSLASQPEAVAKLD